MKDKIGTNSEIAKLRKVIVHRPDPGIGRISPKRSEELLFDDIVHLPEMQEEHDLFVSLLNAFLGSENVLEVEDLLVESLVESPEEKKVLIQRIAEFEEVPDYYSELMSEMNHRILAQVLISGYYPNEDLYMFDPIPNFIFTRDIAVTLPSHIIVTKASKTARQRENLLTRFVFAMHPLFQKVRESDGIINLNLVNEFPPSSQGEAVSLEGGDVMMINKDYLLIGCSERTTAHAIDSLKKELFRRKAVKHIAQIRIPSDRSFMHIDTLFTRISHTDVLAYKPIVIDGLSSGVNVFDGDGASRNYSSIYHFFKNEIDPQMRFILSGGGQSPYQEREQWTDSCNLVAIKPGVAIAYDRNTYTLKELMKHGYSLISAQELLDQIKTGEIDPDDVEKTIITLNSSELSRARGGSHCMTCPISRDDL
ncbi:MAG: arginine deiminase [Bacteroidetes bacterium]|jgi:arginine deiminase|nr:arginine deiminase [Bacteroidota bacterium]